MEKLNFKYRPKANTKSRFIRIEGTSNLMPETLTISTEDCSPRANKGIRNILPKVGNFIGEFRKDEISPYKISPKRPRITGTLFGSKGIFGYSDLAFANEKNEFQRGQDLIIFKLPTSDRIFEVLIFKGGWPERKNILKTL